MSQLKQLKTQITNVGQANRLCESMSSLSSIRTIIFKNKLKTLEEKIKILGATIAIHNANLFNVEQKRHSFTFFSDFGFCGEFNNYKLSTDDIPVGKKNKNSQVTTNNAKDLSIYVKQIIKNNYNFKFVINDFHSGRVKNIHFDIFLKKFKKDNFILLECSDKALQKSYFKNFIEYVFTYGQLQENMFRSKIMKNAVDNSKKWLGELQISANKVRQTTITNEMLLIISGQGVNS